MFKNIFVAQIKEVTSFSLSSKILSTKTPSVASGELEAGPCVRLLVASVQAAPVGRSEKNEAVTICVSTNIKCYIGGSI